tara:strand:- start:648 stop:2024 length:1377 start_codon:yes stop_codon:yes gene_type:complete
MSFNLAADTGLTAIDAALVQEAGRIGSDIHQRTLHTSAWMDLIKQSPFPDGMGYTQQTMIYDRALPTTAVAGNSTGVNWHDIAITQSSDTLNSSVLTGTQPLAKASKQHAGPSGGDLDGDGDLTDQDTRSYINFSKKLKPYTLRRATVESPKMSLEDLRFAVHRQDQLRAIMDLMTEATAYTWENRYRDEYERISANLVSCLATGTTARSTVDGDGDGTSDDLFENISLDNAIDGLDLSTSGASNADISPVANISNAVLDRVYYRNVRSGAGRDAYGRENGRPVFGLICSSEASYQLQTESGFRDDVRYNQAKVSELIAPLGVEKSFRGFYHLVDDLAPRFTISSGLLTRVLPYITTGGIVTDNAAYEIAPIEAAFVLHSEVMESQIPNPFSGSNGVTFDACDYKGKFNWLNIAHETKNPDGTTGFFRGVLASASKPIKTEFGSVVLFKRDSSTPAGV